jgi:hypothetical protein
MEWISDAITPGELEALKITASQAWADDTCYPKWKGSSYGGGQCYVTAVWLTERLGGFVGKKAGHFAWMSPDQSYILDVTGNHTGSIVYEPNDGYKLYSVTMNDRNKVFNKRADLIFNNLESAIKVAADSLVGDAFPGEEPQRQNDIDDQYWHDEPAVTEFPGKVEKYNFFYANGSLEIAPEGQFSHDELARHLKINNDHQGPMASGTVEVVDNKATWDATSNIDLKNLSRVFENYSDQVGWDWGGIVDGGRVVSKALMPVESKTINYVWSDGHLYMGKTSHTVLAINSESNVLCGSITIAGNRAKIFPVFVETLPQLFEWANDEGLKLYGSSNNLVKRYEDMEQENLGKPDGGNFNPVEGDAEDDTDIGTDADDGVHKCPICDEIFPDWHLYNKHRRDEHGNLDNEIDVEEDGGFPDTDMDKTNPPHFTEQQPTTMPVTGMVEASRVDGFDKQIEEFGYTDNDRFYVSYSNGSPIAVGVVSGNELRSIYTPINVPNVKSAMRNKIISHYPQLHTHSITKSGSLSMRTEGWVNTTGNKWVFAAGKEPKDLLTDPIPFIYDIPADNITVGHPGQRTSDIPGKFTPAGIVEGMYEPGGTVNITTMTTMPYTVNHILTLWYYQYPEFSVKRINLLDAEGKKTKLANESL